MVQYAQFFIYVTFILSFFLSSSQGMPEKNEGLDNNSTQQPKSVLKREPDFSHPTKALLNLGDLNWLTGKNKIIGIIEFGGIKHTPPGLEGKVLNTLEGGEENKKGHSTLVSQVVAAQILGLAPDAQVFLAAPQVKTGGTILVNLDDAIKWAVRNGAHAINLSIKLLDAKDELLFPSIGLKSRKNKATYDFLEGIQYALDRGIPVFMAAGNDQQDLLEDEYLKSIWKAVEYSENPHLFFIVGGFDYPQFVSSREEITFSKTSGRAKKEAASRYFVPGPNKVEVYVPVSLEEQRERLKKFRSRLDAFELKGIWIKELKEKLEEINSQALTLKISPLLQQLE